jgi:hypothetical protein
MQAESNDFEDLEHEARRVGADLSDAFRQFVNANVPPALRVKPGEPVGLP